MPKISTTAIYLREVTLDIIERLLIEGKHIYYKSACKEVFNKSKSKHQPTGFIMNDFYKFYKAVMKFKIDIKRQKEISNNL